MKQIIIIVIVVVGIIVGASVFSDKNEEPVTSVTSNNFYGKEDGVITFTEYGDFQCPACGQFYPIVKQVKEQFKDQIRFEFKHFPLIQIHPNAQAAHRAAQAAANQGKFWEMHDLLYENQPTWNQVSNPATVFEGYANQLSLNIEQYQSDVSSSEVLAVINTDVAEGKALNVNSTPTFAIDGEKIEDTTSLSSVESMSQVIQKAIDKKNPSDASDVTDPDNSQSTEPNATDTTETQQQETSGE